METIEEKITKFKMSVVKAQDLEEPWTYFFDELTADDRFLDMGQLEDPEKVTSILQLIAVQALKHKGDIVHQMSIGVPDHQMIHGSCLIDGSLTTYCFLEDLNMGIACFLNPANYHTHMIRFTRMNADADKALDKTFIPRPKSTLLH